MAPLRPVPEHQDDSESEYRGDGLERPYGGVVLGEYPEKLGLRKRQHCSASITGGEKWGQRTILPNIP
jgi:hypothetical protein